MAQLPVIVAIWVGVFALASCSISPANRQPAKTVAQGELGVNTEPQTPQGSGDPGVTPVSAGALIYGQNCASCHMPLIDTEVGGASADVIRFVVTSHSQSATPGPMAFLQDILTAPDYIALERVLADKIKEPEVDTSFRQRPPSATHKLMQDRLAMLFGYSSMADPLALRFDSYSKAVLESKQAVFGGFCTRYDGGCAQAFDDQAEAGRALQTQEVQMLRLAYQDYVCRQLTADSEIVSHALQTAGVPNLAETERNMDAVLTLLQRVHMRELASTEIRSAFQKSWQDWSQDGIEPEVQWQMTLFTVCSLYRMNTL